MKYLILSILLSASSAFAAPTIMGDAIVEDSLFLPSITPGSALGISTDGSVTASSIVTTGPANHFAAYDGSGVLSVPDINTYLNSPLQIAFTFGDGTTDFSGGGGDLIYANQEVTNNASVDNTRVSESYINVDAGGSVSGDVSGHNVQINVNGNVSGQVRFGNEAININTNLPSGVGVQAKSYDANINGAIQYLGMIATNANFNSGAVVAQGAGAFNDNTQIHAGASVDNGYASIGIYPRIEAGSSILGGYTGVNVAADISGDATGSGINYIDVNGSIGSRMDYVSGHGFFTQFLSGASIDNSVASFQSNIAVRSGAKINSYQGLSDNPDFQAGSFLNHYTGVNVGPSINVSLDDSTLANFSYGGVGGFATNASGVRISMNNISSTNQKIGLSIDDGSLGVQSNYDTAILTPAGEFQANIIGGSFKVSSGFPITNGAFGILNNLGLSTDFQDNYTGDSLGDLIDISINGLVNNVRVASGVTARGLNYMTAGGGTLTSGGTITDVAMFNAVGLIGTPGDILVSHMHGFWARSALCTMATVDCYGFKSDSPTARNSFAGDVEFSNGTNFTAMKAAASMSSDVTYTLPDSDGTPGYVLSTDGAGNLSWAASGGGGGGANTALSNLASTAVNTDIIPASAGSISLGSAADPWLSTWTRTVTSDPGNALDLTTTSGTGSGGGTGIIIQPGDPVDNNAQGGIINIVSGAGSGSSPSGLVHIVTRNATGDVSGDINIETGNTDAIHAGDFNLALGTGTSGATGGKINLTAGNGDVSPGFAQITAGSAFGSGGNGAAAGMTGGAGGAGGAGGGVELSAGGTSDGAGTGGPITIITSGMSTGTPGSILLTTGQNNAGAFGEIQILGGAMNLQDSHIKSTLSANVAPTDVVQAAAGTGASCVLVDATDTAMTIGLVTGTAAFAAGAQCIVTFNKAYGNAPLCFFTATNSNAAQKSIYLTSTTTTVSLAFAVGDLLSTTYTGNILCLETY